MSSLVTSRRLENKFVHLTNYSIQKHHYLQKQTSHDSQTYFEDNGSKLTLTRLKAKLKQMNLSFGMPDFDLQMRSGSR